MTLRSSDLQSDSDLDSIRNSCDVFSKFEFSNRVLVAVCQFGGSDLKEVSWIQSGNLRLYAPTTTFQWWHQHVTNEWRISSIELKLGNWSDDKRFALIGFLLMAACAFWLLAKLVQSWLLGLFERNSWKNIAFENAIPWLLHLMPHISNIWSSLHTRQKKAGATFSLYIM